MAEGFIAIDDVPEASLPDWARPTAGSRGHEGSVVLSERGIAHVAGGRGTVAEWGELLGVVEVDGRAFVLAPRKPPRAPWFEVTPKMVPADLGDGTLRAFVAAVSARRVHGNYRGSAKTIGEPMSEAVLEQRIRERQPIPGAVEVPARLLLAPWSAAKGGVALIAFAVGGLLPMMLTVMLAPLLAHGGMGDLLGCVAYPVVGIGLTAAVMVMRRIWRRMDARYFDTHPTPRMLVLAPDGCMVALERGARAFSWSRVTGFRVEGDPDRQDRAGKSWLVVDGPAGPHGAIDGAWFGAPLPLIAAVAEAYRARAARGSGEV